MKYFVEFYFYYRNQILKYEEISEYFSLSEIVRFLSIKNFVEKLQFIYFFLHRYNMYNLVVFFIIYVRFIFRCYNF